MKTKVLILGGAGFIGSAICKYLYGSKLYDIHIIDHPKADLSRIKGLTQSFTVELITLVDTKRIFEYITNHEIKIVIHLVSSLIPNSNIFDYEKETKNIIEPTYDLLNFCAANNILFIYFSSGGAIYGNSKINNYKFKEDDELCPISYYGISKLQIEEKIRYYHDKKKLQYLILRPANAYGPGQNLYSTQGLIAVIIGKIIAGEPIEIWGNGNNIRDFIFIEDIAQIVHQLIRLKIINETINVGSGVGFSVKEVISLLLTYFDDKPSIIYKPGRNIDVNAVILDNSKLKSYIKHDFTPLPIGISKFRSFLQGL